jgi:hypothetical protein
VIKGKSRFRCRCCEVLKPVGSKVIYRYAPSGSDGYKDGMAPICKDCEKAILSSGFRDILNYKYWMRYKSWPVLMYINRSDDGLSIGFEF